MNEKTVSRIMLTLILISMLISGFFPVKGATIYLRYHDNSYNSLFAPSAGFGRAVKFTPPREIHIQKIGAYLAIQAGGPLNVPYNVRIYDASSYPYTELISPIPDTTNGGWDWVDVDPELIIDHDFFVALEWLEDQNPYIGVDTSSPDDRSWSIDFSTMSWWQGPDDHDWDYMITVRADDQLCHLDILSYPFDGIGIKVEGIDQATPHTESFEYGSNVQIEAKASQIERNGETFTFDHWIDYHNFFSKDRVISYTVPTSGYVDLEAIYIGENDIPWHHQETDINCGPASLEMIFDFYGADVSQPEIATVARTAGSGTNLANMRRAAHFSDLSTEDGLNGYTARSLGYAAFEYKPGTSWLGSLKSLIDAGYPIIVSTYYDESETNGHYRVAVDYDDSVAAIRLHDPWDPEEYGYSYKYGGAFLRMDYDDFVDLWERDDYWGLFVSPWIVEVTIPEEVEQDEHFTINATVTYPCPTPFSQAHYLASSTEATLTLPSGFTLADGETPTISIGNLGAGESRTVVWNAIASNVLGSYSITVSATGMISESSSPYSYSDRIGGSGSSTLEVIMPLTVHNLNTGLDYSSIQETIDAPETLDGHTIFVEEGTYCEHIVVFKSLSLLGETATNTIVDGEYVGNVIEVTANSVNMAGFTIRNSGTTSPDCGIYVPSVGNKITDNIVTDNKLGMRVSSSNNNISRNRIESNNKGLYIQFSLNNSVYQNNVTNNGYGIFLDATSDNAICQNNIANNGYGIYSDPSSSKNNITGNDIVNNDHGIHLGHGSNNNSLSRNDIVNGRYGIDIWFSSNNVISGNNITSKFYSCIGIYNDSSNNTVSLNNIAVITGADNLYGIKLMTSNNTICKNNITLQNYGIWLAGSFNIIFHNNFMDNVQQAYIQSGNANYWDDGYPSGGNYWSDYMGLDLYSGPYQNDTGSDGIGDTAYEIDESNHDNYPLMYPWTPPIEKPIVSVSPSQITDYTLTPRTGLTLKANGDGTCTDWTAYPTMKFESHPSNHTSNNYSAESGHLFIDAYDNDTDTYAEFNWEDENIGSHLTLNTFGTNNGTIVSVNFKMKYEATAATRGGQYAIKFSIDGSTWVTLEGPTGAAHSIPGAGYDVWPNVSRPGSGSWTWTDINNLELRVETTTRGRRGGGIFKEYEAWVSVSFGDYSVWDEYPNDDGDTGYVYATISGLHESSTLQDHTTETYTIAKLTVVIVAKGSSNACQLTPILAIGGHLYEGALFSLTTTYSTYTSEWGLNPHTRDYWTWDDIDDLEAGVHSHTVPSGGEIRVTQMYVNVSGSRLAVDIHVSDVEDLWGWQFELSYDPNVIQGVWADQYYAAKQAVEIGSFLGSAGGTVWVVAGTGWNNTIGKLYLNAAFLVQIEDPDMCPNGDGVIATIIFEVVGLGETEIRLNNLTGLMNPYGEWIVEGREYVEDGYFRNIALDQIPKTSFSYYPADTPIALEGHNVIFTANVTGGTPPYSYKWYFWTAYRDEPAPQLDGPVILSTPTTAHNYTLCGDWNVTLSVIDNAGVVSTTTSYVTIERADVAVVSVIPSETRVYAGNIVNLNVTVRNEGTVSETFNVTALYNGNIIQTQSNIPLDPSMQTTLIFSWNTSGVPGSHRISAEASIVPGEADTSDNTFLNGVVEVVTRTEEPVDGECAIIEGNVTIANTVVRKNILRFDASGPSGLTGWINVTFPMINTTEIKVFINNEKLTPPPFPIITTNGTHYFIYFEFTLSTHEIVVLYAIVDVSVTGIEVWPPWAPQGQPLYINVTVENQGDFVETFNLIVYADRNTGDLHFDIGNETVSLSPQESTLLEFIWDTSGVPCGTYWITAEAILPEDADPADNIARTKVGGICVPYTPSPVDLVGLFIPIASAIVVIALLGIAALGLFKRLMCVRVHDWIYIHLLLR